MICPRSFQVVAYFSAESKAGISPAKAVPVRTIRVVVQCWIMPGRGPAAPSLLWQWLPGGSGGLVAVPWPGPAANVTVAGAPAGRSSAPWVSLWWSQSSLSPSRRLFGPGRDLGHDHGTYKFVTTSGNPYPFASFTHLSYSSWYIPGIWHGYPIWKKLWCHIP